MSSATVAVRQFYLFCLQIIEAMPHTEMVSDFIEKLGDFYVLVDDDETPVPNGDLNADGSPKRVGQMLRQHRLAQTSSPARSGNTPILFLLSESLTLLRTVSIDYHST